MVFSALLFNYINIEVFSDYIYNRLEIVDDIIINEDFLAIFYNGDKVIA
jgi:hypothetical protein